MGEVLCSGFNLAVSSPSDSRGSEARICIVATKEKTKGFNHIAWFYFIYIMSSCLKRCSVHHELNTIDAGRSRSIGGVIVADAVRSQSTCHGHDAYIHDHCHEYHHNYMFFYQLFNNNLSIHRMLFL